jgi:hypothetical protein
MQAADDWPQTLTLGSRLRAEIARRVKELESRNHAALTPREKRELAGLRELLRLRTRED